MNEFPLWVSCCEAVIIPLNYCNNLLSSLFDKSFQKTLSTLLAGVISEMPSWFS